ncbi:hypothetical protein HanRHA438_Chr16g0765981 [Helianthus annuus]|nr:hypothetical protein HanRHA438_Chr16g0765981 [Helianthus annuus]
MNYSSVGVKEEGLNNKEFKIEVVSELGTITSPTSVSERLHGQTSQKKNFCRKLLRSRYSGVNYFFKLLFCMLVMMICLVQLCILNFGLLNLVLLESCK